MIESIGFMPLDASILTSLSPLDRHAGFSLVPEMETQSHTFEKVGFTIALAGLPSLRAPCAFTERRKELAGAH